MRDDAGSDLLRNWIARAASQQPEKPWIISVQDGRVVSYGSLKRTTDRVASFLQDNGLGANDRVALLSNNSIEHLLCYLGVMAAGATVCTIHVEMNRNQLDNIFTRLSPKLILYQDNLQLDDLLAATSVPKFPLGHFDNPRSQEFFSAIAQHSSSEVKHGAGPDDDAVIFFTSGTSEKPKGVVLSFREHLGNIDPTADGFGVTSHDRVYDFRSFNWASAQLLGALVPVNRGATLIMAEKFSASRFFNDVRDYKATIAAGNPTTINILLHNADEARRDSIPTLRFITSSSAPLTLEEWRRFEQTFGVPIAQGYGSSETGWIAAVPGEQRRLGTAGRPLPYHGLAIVDADGERLPAGEIGQVEIGGLSDHPYRYLGEDGSVKIHCRGRIRTGDLGYLDNDGFLVLTGREKELIIRGGAKISPVEIDSYLMQYPGVSEAATVGVTDPIYGEEVVSFVVGRPGAQLDAAQLLRHCADLLPAFKAPKHIVISTSLPKTERGKLDRRALAGRWKEEISR